MSESLEREIASLEEEQDRLRKAREKRESIKVRDARYPRGSGESWKQESMDRDHEEAVSLKLRELKEKKAEENAINTGKDLRN